LRKSSLSKIASGILSASFWLKYDFPVPGKPLTTIKTGSAAGSGSWPRWFNSRSSAGATSHSPLRKLYTKQLAVSNWQLAFARSEKVAVLIVPED
jgi:hypothetical protein